MSAAPAAGLRRMDHLRSSGVLDRYYLFRAAALAANRAGQEFLKRRLREMQGIVPGLPGGENLIRTLTQRPVTLRKPRR